MAGRRRTQWQDVGVSSAFPGVSRRDLLAGSGLLVLLALAAPACGTAPAPPAIEELDSQQRLAQHDSELIAAAIATLTGTAPPEMVAALTEVGAERAEHARALAAEIARVTGKPEPAAPQPPEAKPTGSATPAATLSDVVGALRDAAASAAESAAVSAGYRAGLLASIAAACTAAHTVTLVSAP